MDYYRVGDTVIYWPMDDGTRTVRITAKHSETQTFEAELLADKDGPAKPGVLVTGFDYEILQVRWWERAERR